MYTPVERVSDKRAPHLEAMTGSDWMLLEFETPDTPMHTLKMIVVDGAARGRAVTLAEIADVVPGYLSLSPYFTSRVEKVDRRWCWVQDTAFDVANQLEDHTLAEGESFDDLCSVLADRQLDRSRPLWKITLVHGLPQGRQAIVVQVHHALMDGSAAVNTFNRVTTGRRGLAPELPGPAALAGPQDRASLPRRLVAVARAYGDVRRETKAFAPDNAILPRRMYKRSPFNVPSAGGRRCATADLPADDFAELARLTGTKFNGALHGVIAFALRKQLIDDGEAVTHPLVNNFGVVADPSPDRYAGNHLATARLWLHVEDDDPIRALRRTAKSCEEAVALRRRRGFELQTLAAEFAKPIPHFRSRFVHLWPFTPLHFLTAYVRGPSETRWIGDLEVVSFISIAVSVELANVNVVAYTYKDRISFGLITTPESLPDPQGFFRRCGEALEELLELARAEASAGS